MFENLKAAYSALRPRSLPAPAERKNYDWSMNPAEIFGRVISRFLSLSGGSRKIDDKLEQINENRSWVFVCNHLISNEIAEREWYIEQRDARGNWIKVPHAIADDILANPFKPYGTDAELKYILSTCLNLCGEFQINKLSVLNAGKSIIGLTPFDPSKITPVLRYGPGGAQELSGWRVPGANEIPLDQVIFGRFPRADSMYRGMSPIEGVAASADLNTAFSNYNAKLIKNDARPAMLLSPEGDMDDIGEKAARTWADQMRGAIGGVKLLPFGVKKIDSAQSLKDLDFIEGKRSTKEELLAAYNTPEILISGKDANRSTMEMAMSYWLATCIDPRLAIMERAMTRQWIAPAYGAQYRLRFHRRKIEFFDDVIKRDTMLFNYNATTANRYIESHGLGEPLPWGDEKPSPKGAMLAQPGQLPLDDQVPDAPQGQPGPAPKKSAETFTLKGVSVEKSTTRALKWKAFDNVVQAQEGHLADAIRRYVRREKQMVLSRARAAHEKGEAITGAIFDEQKAEVGLKNLVQPFVKNGIKTGYNHAQIAVDGDHAFDNDSVQARAFTDKVANKNAHLMVATINQRFMDLIASPAKALRKAGPADALVNEQEVSFQELMAAIDEIFETSAELHAQMGAATMTIGSVNWGQAAGYMAEGVNGKEWLTQQDDRVRDSHAAMDGQGADGSIPMSGKFTSGDGAQLDFPGDPDGPASEIINCRCTILPVL